jgi:hydrogenase nickel incorporation protein HypA/HybF
MHELSIAVSLIDVAAGEAARLGGARVQALHVRLGPLSGVVREALEFSFDVAAAGTPIEGARLRIEEVPVRVFCADCSEERALPGVQPLRCPVCGGTTPEIVGGRECLLVALEVDDDVATDR